MFWKKIFFLTAWYVAWNIVASIYKGNKKNPSKLKNKQDVKDVAENFLEIQKNFIDDIEKKFLSESSREKLDETKESFHKYANDYLKQGEKLLAELQVSEKYQDTKAKWLSFFENLKFKAQTLYEQARKEEEKIEAQAKEKIQDWTSRVKRAKEELTKKK